MLSKLNRSRIALFTLIIITNLFDILMVSTVQLVLLLVIIIYIPVILEKFYEISTNGTELISGLLIVFSFNQIQGYFAAILVLPWIITTSIVTIHLFLRLDVFNLASKELSQLLLFSSVSFLPMASSALFISRLGLQPVGFSHTIIQLTAVHFHYTGFTIPLFVYFIVTTLQERGKELALPTVLIVIGTPLVAIGITLDKFLRLPGFFAVFIFTSTLCYLAYLVIKHRTNFNILIVIANVIIIPSMLLAIYYATGVAFDIALISIGEMIYTHGIVNAGIYLPLNILGWEQTIRTE